MEHLPVNGTDQSTVAKSPGAPLIGVHEVTSTFPEYFGLDAETDAFDGLIST